MSNWFRVEVSDHEGQIVAIETEMLAGRDIGEVERSVICKAIDHLSGFLGLPNAAAEIERLERERPQTHVVFASQDGTRNLTLSGTAEAADEFARQRWEIERQRDEAIAALRELREPTNAMTTAGFIELAESDGNPNGETGAQIVTRIYRAMLDAAPESARRLLNQKEGT